MPRHLLPDLEGEFFQNHFNLDQQSISERQCLTIYRLFLQESCKKMWLFMSANSNLLGFAIRNEHNMACELILNSLNEYFNPSDLKCINFLTDCWNKAHVMYFACSRGNLAIVDKFLQIMSQLSPEQRAKVSLRYIQSGSEFSAAIFHNHMELAKLLLTKTDSGGNKILRMNKMIQKKTFGEVCKVGNAQLVELFLSINQDFRNVSHYLEHACLNKRHDTEIFQVLLRDPRFDINQYHPHHVNWSDNADFFLCTPITALQTACINGSAKLVQVLLETLQCEDESKRVNVHLTTGRGNQTALHLACENGHWKIVQMLLETLKFDAVKLDVKNNRDETAIELARKKNHPEVVKLLESYRKKET